jgi:hypothetical protein
MATGVCNSSRPIGFCRPIEEQCTEAPTGVVCGCDGKTYQTTCAASLAGQSIASTDPCVQLCGPLVADAGSDGGCEPGTFCEFIVTVAVGAATPPAVCGNSPTAPGTCSPVPLQCDGVAETPVCGCDGKTYASHCEAQRAHISVAAAGACACGGLNDAQCASGYFCNITAGMCDVVGAAGTCALPPTTCDADFSPVCGCNGVTYNNACEAAKARVSIFNTAATAGEAAGGCVCGGPDGGVCPAGSFCDYSGTGSCLQADAVGTCLPIPNSDDCPVALSPVCGCDDNTYGNACLAGASGVSVAFNKACGDGGAGGSGG